MARRNASDLQLMVKQALGEPAVAVDRSRMVSSRIFLSSVTAVMGSSRMMVVFVQVEVSEVLETSPWAWCRSARRAG